MNYFTHSPLYRFSEMRTNTAHIEQLWQQENTQTYLISDLQSLVVNDGEGFAAATIGADRRDAFTEFARVRVYLGSAGGVPYFVLGFEGVHEKIEALLEEAQQFIDLRKVALDLPQEQSAILAYARGIVHWNLRHQHCPDCGQLTHSLEAGHVRQCSSESCGKAHYPRTDTAVIVLISQGDACLLGRQQVWPSGQYAIVAGFLEPGETLEQAVAREAMEETGVHLQSIQYHSSQPWPFPGSIMVGFNAEATNRKLQVNHDELEDARWFTREDVAEGLQQGILRLPPPYSISFCLIRDWFNAEGAKLEDYL